MHLCTMCLCTNPRIILSQLLARHYTNRRSFTNVSPKRTQIHKNTIIAIVANIFFVLEEILLLLHSFQFAAARNKRDGHKISMCSSVFQNYRQMCEKTSSRRQDHLLLVVLSRNLKGAADHFYGHFHFLGLLPTTMGELFYHVVHIHTHTHALLA